MLSQSGAPGCIIGWSNFSHKHSGQEFHWNQFSVFHRFCQRFILLVLLRVEVPLCLV